MADHVTFTYLRVIEVEVDPELWAVDSRYQIEHVRRRVERTAGMFTEIQVLKGELHAFLFGHVADTVQRVTCANPHARRDMIKMLDRQPVIAKTGPMEVQSLHAKSLSDPRRLARRGQHKVRPCFIGKAAAHQTGTITERVCSRTDFPEQRRMLMEARDRYPVK